MLNIRRRLRLSSIVAGRRNRRSLGCARDDKGEGGDVIGYSGLKASTGFTEEARRAGIRLASKAEQPSSADTAAKVEKSHACTPKSRLRIRFAAAIEHNRPAIIPIAVSQAASFRMRRWMAARCA